MCSVCASTRAFWLPMPPKPTMAMLTVSPFERRPRPRTRSGTRSGALAATIVPSVALPASVTNSRRVRSFGSAISMLRLRLPFAPCDGRNELVEAARWECECLALLRALIGRHEDFYDLEAVVESQ